MITTDKLIKAGWKFIGCGWYYPSGKILTNSGGEYQLWANGAAKAVTLMSELGVT